MTTATSESVGLTEEVVTEYLQLRAQQRELEKQARAVGRQANMLESTFEKYVEDRGGIAGAGQYTLGIESKPGVPSYKSICERLVVTYDLPAKAMIDLVAATPDRRVLVIV